MQADSNYCTLLNNPTLPNMDNLGIAQVEWGPLKIKVSKVLKLVQKQQEPFIAFPRFKGSLTIKNRGTALVAYKILTRRESNLKVKPTHALLQSNSSTSVKVSTRPFESFDVAEFDGLLILATACKTDTHFNLSNLPLFWKRIIKHGGYGFVDTFKIKRCCLVDASGVRYLLDRDSNMNEKDVQESDTESYLTTSTKTKRGTDSEDTDSCGSDGLLDGRYADGYTLQDIEEVATNLNVNKDMIRKWVLLLLLILLLAVLAMLQRLGNIDAEIFLSRKAD